MNETNDFSEITYYSYNNQYTDGFNIDYYVIVNYDGTAVEPDKNSIVTGHPMVIGEL